MGLSAGGIIDDAAGRCKHSAYTPHLPTYYVGFGRIGVNPITEKITTIGI